MNKDCDKRALMAPDPLIQELIDEGRRVEPWMFSLLNEAAADARALSPSRRLEEQCGRAAISVELNNLYHTEATVRRILGVRALGHIQSAQS